MLLEVKVITGASKNEVIKLSNNSFRVKITTSPQKGKANKALIKLLADYFNISKSLIKIKSGEKSKNKIIKIQSPLPS